jgi:hypothetical protein
MAEPKTTSAKTVSKSDFIRQRPAVLSAAEVVARGKAEGIEFAPQLVYRVRGSAMKKRKPAKRAATARATKPASAASSKPTLPSKSDFIRAQAATLSAAEVVAKAKAQGIKIDPALVYKVWGRSKAKIPTTKAAAAPVVSSPSTVPVTKPNAASAKLPKSKADFVRAYPNLSPKEIVQKAKAAGVKFDARYVYRVRAMDKTARKAKRAAVKTTTSTPAHANEVRLSAALSAASSSNEDLLRAVAAELGLGRAVEVLQGERARVRAVIGV